ncbi:hypothetical protein CH63R_05940 [Colletotrichum higginsianum IMI 349063]|uniref:Uncharacterized protein n=1 Tax=Colletotrichum higginsianum (strain IMI 349063) TaxID=759273 RepID=A0A1B7YEK2_COLHI|nr:hypothetical protein CH63R_05940 [Colletotrichum higginsianum IMI 349063]OBR10248.1 hypothetical protein CH63R_05940 [Colletotrichum higginsianum IMI 349063]
MRQFNRRATPNRRKTRSVLPDERGREAKASMLGARGLWAAAQDQTNNKQNKHGLLSSGSNNQPTAGPNRATIRSKRGTDSPTFGTAAMGHGPLDHWTNKQNAGALTL